jgi:TonB family protein
VPTLTESEPPPAPRAARRRQGRLPLPSIKATPRPPPPPPASRGYLIPIVIVLSLLLVAAGVGYFFYRRHAGAGLTTSSSGGRDPASRSASSSSAAPAASAAPVMADNASTPAAATPPPPANPVAAQQAGNPSTPSDSKAAAGALPLLRPLPKAAAAMANGDNCPYPREAMDKGVTGTVLLLVYVSPDGKPAKSKMDRTSGSEALDVAATRCVEQFARFAAPSEGMSGYWGRVRFKWSVGG